MSWFRVGDTAATDPRILALEDPKDPLLGTLCFGFLVKLGTLSASNKTDYVLTQGFLIQAGGPAWQTLLKRCVREGLIVPLDGRGAGRRWKLIDDAPELFHMLLKDEQTWAKQQKSDTRSDRFRLPVLLRDGDSCRYCGVVVQPNDNKSGRGRTIDHRQQGRIGARTADDLVVCCRRCNTSRNRDWQNESDRDGFADRWPLLPVPSPLIFIRSTVIELEGKGYTIPAGSVIAERADPARETPTVTTSGPEMPHPANAGVAAPARTPTSGDPHPSSQPGVANQSAAGATHPAPAGVAAPSPDAPDTTHPAAAGVAVSESRTDRSATDRSGTASPGRVGIGSGSGRVGPSPRASPTTSSPIQADPRRTRRGRRRTSSGRQQ